MQCLPRQTIVGWMRALGVWEETCCGSEEESVTILHRATDRQRWAAVMLLSVAVTRMLLWFKQTKMPLPIFGLTDSDSTAVLPPVCDVSEKAHSGCVHAFL